MTETKRVYIMYINEEECKLAGLNQKDVERIAKNLSKWGREAEKLGITIFGGGSGSLRFSDDMHKGDLIIAFLDGRYDGGDGAAYPDDEGLIRGENL